MSSTARASATVTAASIVWHLPSCCYTVGDYHSMIINGYDPKKPIRIVSSRSRNNARTPCQRNSSQNAGFTIGKPWECAVYPLSV